MPRSEKLRAEPNDILKEVLSQTRAEAGYLYLVRPPGALELLFATCHQRLPDNCQDELVAQLITRHDDTFDTTFEGESAQRNNEYQAVTVVDDASGTPLGAGLSEQTGYWFALHEGGVTEPVGALVLVEGKEPIRRLSRLVLQELKEAVVRGGARPSLAG